MPTGGQAGNGPVAVVSPAFIMEWRKAQHHDVCWSLGRGGRIALKAVDTITSPPSLRVVMVSPRCVLELGPLN